MESQANKKVAAVSGLPHRYSPCHAFGLGAAWIMQTGDGRSAYGLCHSQCLAMFTAQSPTRYSTW